MEEILCCEDGETEAQRAQRGSRCPIPGTIPGQGPWGSEQPSLVADVPADGREVRVDNL